MNEKETEQARRIHEKYPSSLAFSDWMNPGVSFEERLLEFKLENQTINAKVLLQEHTKQYMKQKLPSLLPPVVLPDIKRFRGDRDYCLRALSQVRFPEPPTIEADYYVEEVCICYIYIRFFNTLWKYLIFIG